MESQRFFGSDPEYFIYKTRKETESGNIPNIIPPAGLIADMGIKFTLNKNGKRVLLERNDYRFIEDGAALELNYKHPINDIRNFISLTTTALNDMETMLRKIDFNLKLSKDVLGFFDTTKYWKNRDKSFHDCVRFGCDPDVFPKLYILNSFESEMCKEIDASKHQYRYAGGHLHLQNMSEDSDVYYNNSELAPIILDFIVGTTNILLQRTYGMLSQEKERLKFYGRPGRIRLQQYSDKVNGIEYRPPSNQWLSNPYSVNQILSSANIAAIIIEKNMAKNFFLSFQDRITDMWKALTTHDKNLSKKILIDSLTWSLENHIITLNQLDSVYGQFYG